MYCPQCGTESSQSQQYCRACGANLKVIAKAVTLSEAIARSDRGPLPKIKEMMKNIKVEQVTEEISRALDQMNKEIARSSPPEIPFRPKRPRHASPDKPWWVQMKEEQTPEQRREEHLVKGTVSFFTGIALTIFLYYFSAALVLKVSPEQLARIPFELEPVLRMAWMVGLIPTLSGLGRITAGLCIKPAPAAKSIDAHAPSTQTPAVEQDQTVRHELRDSITEHTTEMLDWKPQARRTSEMKE